MDWAFFKKDLQYIFLNQIVSSIPSWTIRNFFYKCSGMKIGPKARIGINTVIISPKGITIGCRSVINDHCVLDGSGGLQSKMMFPFLHLPKYIHAHTRQILIFLNI